MEDRREIVVSRERLRRFFAQEARDWFTLGLAVGGVGALLCGGFLLWLFD